MASYEYKVMPESIADSLEKIKAEQYAEWRAKSMEQFISDHSGGKSRVEPLTLDQTRDMKRV